MESDFDSIVEISEPFEEVFEGDIASVTIEENQTLPVIVDEDTLGLSFNFDIAMALIEENSVTVDAEFTEAVGEIHGQNTFPCQRCEKVCKSKCGLTRHVNAKHSDHEESVNSLTKEELNSLLDAIKRKITEDNLWGTEVLDYIPNVTSTDSLFDVLLPLYSRFCRKNNQDLLLKEFYGLIPKSTELLSCQNHQICSLIMIHIPDHLVSFYKTGSIRQQTTQTEGEEGSSSSTCIEISEKEMGPLAYVAGYVLSNLYKKCLGKGRNNEELQELLQSMKSQSINPYISARSRGGLITPCDDLIKILQVVEILFRNLINSSKTVVKAIPCDSLCNAAMNSPLVKSLWENITVRCNANLSSTTNKLCLENIIKLYVKVRSFSYAKDYINKFKIKQKTGKSKGLRTELKRK